MPSGDPFFLWLAGLKDLVVSSVLIIVLYGGTKRWWVFGYQLTDAQKRESDTKLEYEARLVAAQKREDEWKELALAGGQVAHQAVVLAREGRRSQGRDEGG